MTIRKTEEDHWVPINQKSVGISITIKSAPIKKVVKKLTIEQKNSTIQTNTKQNSVLHISMACMSVIMGSFVPLHILKMSFQQNSQKSLYQIWTSTYSILKLSGVHIGKTTMKEMSVSMLITGKITEENLQSSHILKTCVHIGIRRNLLLLTKMVALQNINAISVMVGKNKNFTPTFLKSSHAYMEELARSLIVPITMEKLIESILFLHGLSTPLKQEW